MVAVLKQRGAPSSADFHEAISKRSDCWYSACLKITRNPDLAADAVQDALLSAWNKRHQFRQSARLDTWIHRIAINAALNLIRRSKPGVFDAFETDIVSDDSTPDIVLQDHELECELAAQLAALTDIERVCFVLKHLEDWRANEIADELDSNEGRVKQAVFRAVKKLRAGLHSLQEEKYEQR